MPPARPPKPVTPARLENAALRYLERFASSAASLRRVLMRRVERSVAGHGTDREEAAGWVEALIARYTQSGLLDDAGYAAMRTGSLHRRGASTRQIRETLAAKGVSRETTAAALERLAEDESGDLDRRAAATLAKRRRLGPYRSAETRADHRDKDLAALGRAGFDYETARFVVDAESPEALAGDLD
jgi:regulatory protein